VSFGMPLCRSPVGGAAASSPFAREALLGPTLRIGIAGNTADLVGSQELGRGLNDGFAIERGFPFSDAVDDDPLASGFRVVVPDAQRERVPPLAASRVAGRKILKASRKPLRRPLGDASGCRALNYRARQVLRRRSAELTAPFGLGGLGVFGVFAIDAGLRKPRIQRPTIRLTTNIALSPCGP
jgi:hypothetical protein